MLLIGLLMLAHITWSTARQPGCDERGPICGNDGKTYSTMCQLIWARLEDSDLAVLHEGSCNGKYFTSMLDPSAPQGSASGKMLNKLMKNKKPDKNYEKIRAIMPVGWPPLGPMLLTPGRPELNISNEK